MNTIISWFNNFIDYLLSGLKSFFDWLLKFLLESIDMLVSPLADALPDVGGYLSGTGLGEFLVNLNAWVAVDLFYTLALAYFGFVLLMIIIKLVIKLFVPFVG